MSPKQPQDDLHAFPLKDIAGYTPANPDFTLAKGNTARTAMFDAQDTSAEAQAAADAARDDEVAVQWAFHGVVLAAKTQVKAQLGDSSNEIQAFGLNKKSEYKGPTKKSTPHTVGQQWLDMSHF